jgi:hypothetical protein
MSFGKRTTPFSEEDIRSPLAEFTYNTAKHKTIGMSPFEADIGYVPWLPLDLIAPSPQTPGLHSGATHAEKMAKILKVLRERMEERQLTITIETNEMRQPHPFRMGTNTFNRHRQGI